MKTHSPHPPTPSPSERGGEKQIKPESDKEATYRALASRAMVKIARDLRQRETEAEIILWEALRNRRLANLKFRQQHPIGNTTFVADFLCYEHRLVVEVDGEVHSTQVEQDLLRQQVIEEVGYQVLRFSNDQVLNHLEDVLTMIISFCLSSPLALRERGRG
jgi:very-short-patch-repair endonuclease